MMYDHEETITGSVRYGLTGVLGQLNKARGAEASAQYIAEGAWNPQIRCQSFYEDYLRRLFGPAALDGLLRAYLLIEENETAMGWHGRRGLFGTYHHGNRMGVSLRKVDYHQSPMNLERPKIEKDIQSADQEREFWNGRAAHCRQALELLREARPHVSPGAREELDYVVYKTENYVTILEELSAAYEAQALFDHALLAIDAGEFTQARNMLSQSQAALDRATQLVHEAAQQMIPYANIPTERHILYLFNDAIPPHEAAHAYLAEVNAFFREKD